MVGGDDGACPVCGTAVAGEPWCGSCGLELQGRDAEELRSLAAQLAATEVELKVIGARRAALADQLATRRWAHGLRAATEAPTMRHEQPTHPPTAVPASAEWNLERVRNVLLWTGVALLAFAALAFTAVAWTHLGSMGRAELLITITLVAAAAAVATSGRLPATSGALTGLTIALALIDWQIARRAGAASGLSGPTWWAIAPPQSRRRHLGSVVSRHHYPLTAPSPCSHQPQRSLRSPHRRVLLGASRSACRSWLAHSWVSTVSRVTVSSIQWFERYST